MTEVKIVNGALDEDRGRIVLRGAIDDASLRNLKVDSYQRHDLEKSGIFKAMMEDRQMPDIVLGMRGQRFKSEGKTSVILLDDVYIIDGFQRASSARRVMESHPDKIIHLGAKIYFDTVEEWERLEFERLNSLSTKVSPNVLLRNRRQDSVGILTLYGLTNSDKSFPLYKRVCWQQSMARSDLMTAMMLAKTTCALHQHNGRGGSMSVRDVVPNLDSICKNFKMNVMRDNVKTFYGIVEECFGISSIQYRLASPQVKETFTGQLARVFSDHKEFWDESDTVFSVENSIRSKLAKFPIHDPQVVNLASSSGKAREMLYALLRDHINSGKRTRRLTARDMIGRRSAPPAAAVAASKPNGTSGHAAHVSAQGLVSSRLI